MSATPQPVIVARALSKRYSEAGLAVDVFSALDLEVAAGQIIAIIGASGAGKSTLLHLLGGLDQPTSGSVHIDGTDIHRLGETARGRLRNRALGFVYQFHHLLPEFSALENVAMPLLIRGQSADQASGAAAAMLARVGLAARVDHRPGELSGGERQRAAVARALVSQPLAVLADEPTGNLDERNADQVFELMLELNRALGLALVLVTHSERLARKAQTVYALTQGKLQAV